MLSLGSIVTSDMLNNVFRKVEFYYLFLHLFLCGAFQQMTSWLSFMNEKLREITSHNKNILQAINILSKLIV